MAHYLISALSVHFGFLEVSSASKSATSHGTDQFLCNVKRLQITRVLILDDLLMTAASTDDIANLTEIIDDRSQIGLIIVTTRYPPADWHRLMLDPTLADATCDRRIHTSTIIPLRGESLSKRDKNEKDKQAEG